MRLYALSTCVWCRKAKRFPGQSHIEYEHVDVDELDADERSEAREEVKRLAGRIVFPTVAGDGRVIAGYDESKLRELLESGEP